MSDPYTSAWVAITVLVLMAAHLAGGVVIQSPRRQRARHGRVGAP